MSATYKEYRRFATPRQVEYINAVAAHGSQKKAATALGINLRTLERSLTSLKKQATLGGYDPDHDMTHPAPDGYGVKGVSSYYGADGELGGQWVKIDRDQERMLQLAREVVEALCSDIKPQRAAPAPKRTDCELLNLYTITDFHLGMYAWHEETGADWDTTIAEDLLVAWFERAIAQAPAAEVGVLAQLGDFLHHDGLESVTPEHHNVLDADSRFEKLVRVAIRALQRIVQMLLRKHARVHIIMAEGNHDLASSVWLREMFAARYEDEPRVTVDRSPAPYYAYEWGGTLLAFHHGHKRTPANVDRVIAGRFREEFGRTKHAYAHLGHKHQAELNETPLMIVEQHRTLAAADAYASRGGWLSGRSASVITYSRDHGEVGRLTISPEMVSG